MMNSKFVGATVMAVSARVMAITPRPDWECMTYDQWFNSDGVCIDQWDAWEADCDKRWDAECSAVDYLIQNDYTLNEPQMPSPICQVPVN